MSAYADDVSLFLRDSSSFVAFMCLFTINSELLGAQINIGKSRALRFGAFPVDLLGKSPWCDLSRFRGGSMRDMERAPREGKKAARGGLTVKTVVSRTRLRHQGVCFGSFLLHGQGCGSAALRRTQE